MNAVAHAELQGQSRHFHEFHMLDILEEEKVVVAAVEEPAYGAQGCFFLFVGIFEVYCAVVLDDALCEGFATLVFM